MFFTLVVCVCSREDYTLRQHGMGLKKHGKVTQDQFCHKMSNLWSSLIEQEKLWNHSEIHLWWHQSMLLPSFKRLDFFGSRYSPWLLVYGQTFVRLQCTAMFIQFQPVCCDSVFSMYSRSVSLSLQSLPKWDANLVPDIFYMCITISLKANTI